MLFTVSAVFVGTREKIANSSVEQKCARIATASALSSQHIVKLPRLFDAQTDHFTMVTEQMDKYKFVHPYAGSRGIVLLSEYI